MPDETPTPEPTTEDVAAHGFRHQANEPVDEDAEEQGLKLGTSATEAEKSDA